MSSKWSKYMFHVHVPNDKNYMKGHTPGSGVGGGTGRGVEVGVAGRDEVGVATGLATTRDIGVAGPVGLGLGDEDFFLAPFLPVGACFPGRVRINSKKPSSSICFVPNEVAFASFDCPASSPTIIYFVFLLTFPVTFPPYFLIKSDASSRSRESRTPVITKVSPSRQSSSPSGTVLEPGAFGPPRLR